MLSMVVATTVALFGFGFDFGFGLMGFVVGGVG